MVTDVVRRFDAAARTYSDLVALELAGEAVTYGELRRRVNGLVARLDAAGQRVGVCVGKTLDGPTAYLAVLVAGRSAVPMSPSAPAARVAAMTAAADVKTVVTDGTASVELREAWAAAGIDVIDARDVPPADDAPRPPLGHEAYVLFTSGSTGMPKGVRIPHAAVTAYVEHVVARSALGPGCRLTHMFELTFDPSVFDVLAGLTSGATLVIPDAREAGHPVDYVNRRAVTHWYSVPSVISVARQMRLLAPGSMPGLRRSGFIGEPLTLDQARAWAEAAPNSVVENVYGPTELTVSCTEYELPRDPATWPAPANGTVPIGVAYPHLEWCLVDGGAVAADEGELCMRGNQRLISYLDPADDAGRFYRIDGGAARDHDATADSWYRTGDRIRISDGVMIHLGRLDRQVKINGYRIELGEVEQHVRGVEGVLDAAAVTADSRTGRLIVAFYTGAELAPHRLRDALARSMPAYMIPERFTHVADLPRNDRGKTDYRSLQAQVAS
jgi:amino acid adenylation domain-containing protein